jgi:protein-S-isoprenylcysteine O-methyltransferase Ste14
LAEQCVWRNGKIRNTSYLKTDFMPGQGVGAEHPLNDRLQILFLIVFLAVWVFDSLFLHYALDLFGVIVLLVTVPLGVLTFAAGIILAHKSEDVVFHNHAGTVIDSGVYSHVRHPMYLGLMLILLGFSITTVSILSLFVWIAMFLFLDRMAAYEEHDLTRILGQQYVDYRKRVPKWLPYKLSK